MKIREGKPLRFDVWVGGEPTPIIEWFIDGMKVINDDTTSLTVYTKNSSAYTLKNAVLSIPRVNCSDKINTFVKFLYVRLWKISMLVFTN